MQDINEKNNHEKSNIADEPIEIDTVSIEEENAIEPEIVIEKEIVLEESVTEPIVIKTSPPKKIKIKKQIEAERLVEEAKEIVKQADEQTEACKLLLVSDLNAYEKAKDSLRSGGLDACIYLLDQLGYSEINANAHNNHENIIFESKSDIASMTLNNIASGKFTGVLYAILGGAVSFATLVYLATEKLGITLDISTLPSVSTVEKIAGWFSTSVGLENDMYIGAGILGLSTVAIMALIYAIRVVMKSNKNLLFANQQLEEAYGYQEAKGHCKWEMDKVDTHMQETLTTLKIYEVLLNEQKGKLERILYIEGAKVNNNEYHRKSLMEIDETKELIESISGFMKIPMSDEGKLSEASIAFLEQIKMKANKILTRLY